MPTPPDLAAAYAKAEYIVFGEPALVLRIGEHNPAVDALLEADGAAGAAYLTPANPRGERWSREENLAALYSFHDSLRDTDFTCHPGEGRDPEGRWEAEPSLLVVGITLEDAEAIGLELEQNAIVYVERGRAPRLIFL
jgi:hypothetical protein